MTEINETLVSEAEALRSEDLEVVNSTRNDVLHILETVAKINNSKLTPEIRDTVQIPNPHNDGQCHIKPLCFDFILRYTSARPAPGLVWAGRQKCSVVMKWIGFGYWFYSEIIYKISSRTRRWLISGVMASLLYYSHTCTTALRSVITKKQERNAGNLTLIWLNLETSTSG